MLMMPMFRLLSIYFLLFFIVGFWPHRPCNDGNYYFSSMPCFPLLTNFSLCVCYVGCLCLCNASLLVVV